MMTTHLLAAVMAYGFALVFSLIFGSLAGALLWREGSRPSTIFLGAGGTVAGFMTLAAAVLDHFLR